MGGVPDLSSVRKILIYRKIHNAQCCWGFICQQTVKMLRNSVILPRAGQTIALFNSLQTQEAANLIIFTYSNCN